MKRYIATHNKKVSCIYGSFIIVAGQEVPENIANCFPQYVLSTDEFLDNFNQLDEEPKRRKTTKGE
jgi:hypothetical protein